MTRPIVRAFFDEATFTVSYVVSDPESARAAIIDPVLDYDPDSGRTCSDSADEMLAYIKDADLGIDWILETHVHADHLSGAAGIKTQVGGRTGIGTDVAAVQNIFKEIFNIADLPVDGSQFDHLFVDGETFAIFPFQRLGHSFAIGGFGQDFDPEKEKRSNDLARAQIKQLMTGVEALVDRKKPRAVQKSEHYLHALEAQLKICDDVDRLIDTLDAPFLRPWN